MVPEDIDGLKPEDVVVTSTPQSRKQDAPPAAPSPAAPPAAVPPAVVPPAKEEKKKEGAEGDGLPELTEDEITDRIAEIEAKEEKDITDEDRKFLDDYTEPIEPGDEEEEEEGQPAETGDFDWAEFSEEVGLEMTSDEDVVEALKELAGYKDLSPALQKAIEIEQDKGDVALYFKSLATDPKNLSDRDALWEQYVVDNPKRVSVNPKFARLDFDRKQDKEYSLLIEYEGLSASEQKEFLEEHKAELEYLTEKRKFDAEAARASLQEARGKMTFKQPAVAEKTEEEMRLVFAAHDAGYKKALAEFDVVSLSMGDGFEFNVGLSEVNKQKATEWMKNPESFLNELGFHKGKIDYDSLAGWTALLADIKYGTFGERVRQAILDNKDIKTLENTLDAPGIIKTGEGKAPVQMDEWQAVADAFEKKRLEAKKK